MSESSKWIIELVNGYVVGLVREWVVKYMCMYLNKWVVTCECLHRWMNVIEWINSWVSDMFSECLNMSVIQSEREGERERAWGGERYGMRRREIRSETVTKGAVRLSFCVYNIKTENFSTASA